MPQPPNAARLAAVLDRARVLHGEDVAEHLAESLVADWTAAEGEGPHAQAMHAAVWQLVRAASYRARGEVSLANMTDHLAEACVTGWRDELTVRTASVEDAPPG